MLRIRAGRLVCGGGFRERESVAPRYRVRLSVPRIGGLRAWGLAEADFERRLVMQELRR